MLVWYNSQVFTDRSKSGCSLKLDFMSWKCFSLHFWFAVRKGWTLSNSIPLMQFSSCSNIWEILREGQMFSFCSLKVKQDRVVPGLHLLQDVCQVGLQSNGGDKNVILKVKGMQLAKILFSTTVIWSSSLLCIQWSRIFSAAFSWIFFNLAEVLLYFLAY